MINLKTERFIVRTLLPEQVGTKYLSWWNDPDIQQGLNQRPRDWSIKDAQRHVAKFNKSSQYHLGIWDRETRVMVGFTSIFFESNSCAQTNTVIGDKDYWGAGVVLEVRARVLEMLFNHFNIFKVTGNVFAHNVAALHNYRAQGFTCEGVLRQEAQHFEGGRVDVVKFGLLKEEWLEQQDKGDSDVS